MSFDGLVTKAVVSELQNVLTGGKINKIFEPTKDEIILGIYNNGINYALMLCINPEFCRICLTTNQKKNPQNAYNFCMLLRKYLIGSKILSISTYDLERTVKIEFESYNELNDLVKRYLYIEIMSRQSNIILTNENNIIIDTLRHLETESRELLPAHEYLMVTSAKSSFLELQSSQTFINLVNNNSDNSLIKILSNLFIGFSTNFIKETLNILDVKDSNYTDSDLETIYNHIKNIISNLESNNISCKTSLGGSVHIVLNKKEMPLDVNFFIDDFYLKKEQEIKFNVSKNNLIRLISSNLKKIYKKLENINNKIKDCEKMDTYRLYGEILTANLYKLSSTSNIDSIDLENYYDNSIITIPLDSTISIGKNIEKYFKKYNKLKNALNIVNVQKKETEKEIEYMESIVFSLGAAKNISDIDEIHEEIIENIKTKKVNKKNEATSSKKSSKKDSINLNSIIIDGYTVYIGKNNVQNDYLTLKFASKDDIWFHVQESHGSHIVLKTNKNTDIPKETLYKCAVLAMQNSKASNSSNVAVDYCLVKYIKKPSGLKPGMVIYTNFKTMFVK